MNFRIPVRVTKASAEVTLSRMIEAGFEAFAANKWEGGILYGFRQDGKLNDTEILFDDGNKRYEVIFRP